MKLHSAGCRSYVKGGFGQVVDQAAVEILILHSGKPRSHGGSGIRETEEARALLADQLNSLYWWVFNAFKMKEFIRAKALDELQRGDANGSSTRPEQRDLAEAHASPERKRPNK